MFFADGMRGMEGTIELLMLAAGAVGLLLLGAIFAGFVKAYRSGGWKNLALAISIPIGLIGIMILANRPPTVLSSTIETEKTSIANGTRLQCHLRSKMSNGETQENYDSRDWKSSSANVKIAGDGSATAQRPGSAQIQVTDDRGFVVTLDLTVTNATVRSIAIEPPEWKCTASSQKEYQPSQRFTARAHFSDGTTQDVSDVATWSSSNSKVLSTLGAPGRADATVEAPGKARVMATFRGVSGSAICDVLPVP